MKHKLLKTLLLQISLLVYSTLNFVIKSVEDDPLVRNIVLSSPSTYNMIEEKCNDCCLDYDEDNNVCLSGLLKYNQGIYNSIDNVAFDNVTEDNSINIECKFDAEQLMFVLELTLLDCFDNIVEKETIESNAIITEYGGLDAFICLSENCSFHLSDVMGSETIDECGLFSTIVSIATIVVAAYVVVAETAEQIRSKKNLKFNQNIEKSGNGVKKGNYIYDQQEQSNNGRKSAKYHFGFTDFSHVGCEVAAGYNLLIELGKAEMLSEVIYSYEKLLIENSIGWGSLGSDPNFISRFLNKKGISFVKKITWENFKKEMLSKNCLFIIAEHNQKSLSLHTFFGSHINKTILAYNLYGSTNGPESIRNFNDLYYGWKFIVGYII